MERRSCFGTRCFFLALFFIGTVLTAPPVLAQDAPSVNAEEPRVIGLKFYADWCGKCQQLDPKLEELMPEFEGEEIVFVRFDFTNEYRQEQSKYLAGLTGLEDVYRQHEGRTGYMVLLDRQTHEELGRLTHEQSEEALRDEIRRTLAETR